MTLEEQLAEQARKGLLGLGFEQDTAEEYAPWASMLAQFLPGVGEAVGADLTRDAIQDERYGDAAIEGGLTLLGAVPIVGDFAAAAIKGIRRAPTSLLDDAVDVVKKGADEVFDEAAWIKANPHPFPGIRKKDLTTDQAREYQRWHTAKGRARDYVEPEPRDTLFDDAFDKADWESRNPNPIPGKRQRDMTPDELKDYKSWISRRHYAGRGNKEAVIRRNVEAAAIRRAADPSKSKAAVAKRRAARSQRSVPWSSREKIDEIYRAATEATKETGIPHEVDHVIPLRGKNADGPSASGLHHQDNLLVVPRAANRSKANIFEPGDLPPRAGIRKSRAYLKKIREAQEAAKRK